MAGELRVCCSEHTGCFHRNEEPFSVYIDLVIPENQMRGKINRRLFGAFLLFIITIATQGQGTNSNRIALVIGVQNYTTVAPLRHSLNDAHDMAEALRTKGFQVDALYDPKTKREIKDAITRYYKAMMNQRGAAGVIYYAGHGIQFQGDNYLIPATADLQNPGDVEDQCVKMNTLMAVLESASNSLNIFLLDACRKNMFTSFSRDVQQGLNKVSAPQGSIVVFATQPGTIASDGTGRNGLFTSKVLKYINEPNLNIGDVFKKVKQDVFVESDRLQLPSVEDNSIGSDFYFSQGAESMVTDPFVAPKTELVNQRPELKSAESPYDSIFTSRGKMAVNIKEITDDAVKFSYPGEELTNSVHKNTVYKIRLKSGRVEQFADMASMAVVRSGEDWEKVTVTLLENDLKGLVKLETISTKATGTTAFASAEAVRERAYKKLRIQTAMLGGNTVFVSEKSKGTSGGSLMGPSTKSTALDGIAFAFAKPDFAEFKKILDGKTEFKYLLQQSLGGGTSELSIDNVVDQPTVKLTDAKTLNGFIVLKANIKGEERTEFRVIFFDDKTIVLMYRDKNKIFNEVLGR
jgi:hypothetical protein